jgi:hypothetical protein
MLGVVYASSLVFDVVAPTFSILIHPINNYQILLSIVYTFFIENESEILPAHYTWKVPFTNLIHIPSIQVKW